MRRNEYLYRKLELLSEYGVSIFLNGKPATPDLIARRVTDKGVHYTPGFVYSLDGNLAELNYVKTV